MCQRGSDIGIPSIPMGSVERKRSREMSRKVPTPDHCNARPRYHNLLVSRTTHTFTYSSYEDLSIKHPPGGTETISRACVMVPTTRRSPMGGTSRVWYLHQECPDCEPIILVAPPSAYFTVSDRLPIVSGEPHVVSRCSPAREISLIGPNRDSQKWYPRDSDSGFCSRLFKSIRILQHHM
jgi:hypothetical protein